MPFNKDINGFKNEAEFVSYLNNKKVKKVNPIFQDLLFKLFDNLSYQDTIKCYLNKEKQKADMFIVINNVKKGISIKKGVKNSVHVETISSFTDFLKENGMKKKLIKEVLMFHYGDNTIDGTGKERMTSLEYKEKYQKKLDLINEFFNQEKMIEKAVSRFVLRGNNSEEEIDALIYGVIDDFIWITKEEIISISLAHKDIKRTGLSFGPLFYQPLNRCINRNEQLEDLRHKIQIKWYHLSDDIIETMMYRNKAR